MTGTESGRKALRKLKEQKFDHIFMDLVMPHMDGYETTKKIRAMKITTPITALTADTLPNTAKKCLKAGMNKYMSKPLDIIKIAELVGQAKKDAFKYGSIKQETADQKDDLIDIEKIQARLRDKGFTDLNFMKTDINDLRKFLKTINKLLQDPQQKYIYDMLYTNSHNIKGIFGRWGLTKYQETAGAMSAAMFQGINLVKNSVKVQAQALNLEFYEIAEDTDKNIEPDLIINNFKEFGKDPKDIKNILLNFFKHELNELYTRELQEFLEKKDIEV